MAYRRSWIPFPGSQRQRRAEICGPKTWKENKRAGRHEEEQALGIRHGRQQTEWYIRIGQIGELSEHENQEYSLASGRTGAD
jgi:hypothetical protein